MSRLTRKQKKFALLVCYFMVACAGKDGNDSGGCDTLDCRTSKYNLFLADVDLTSANPTATNIHVVISSSYQDMTHPRVSPDNNWVAYTTYNVRNSENCASTDSGYVNTEIKATRLDSGLTRSIIAANAGELNSNNYWYGSNFQFTFLSGAPGATKIFAAQTDADMNLVGAPSQVTVPATIIPFDPQAISDTQLVYAGVYDSTGQLVKSVFFQSLNPADTPIGLSLGRDSMGNVLAGNDIMENDPKLSPDGTQVAFMRRAPNAGSNGFGWRIFVVTVPNPSLTESNISATLGSDQLVNDVLPEWVDNTNLVFSNIDSTVTFNTRTLYVMQSDGSARRQINMPSGYRYSDVYPFKDTQGSQKIIVAAEKIDAGCSP